MPVVPLASKQGSGIPGSAFSVSIVICTRGRIDELRETLASLSLLLIPATMRAELLVVENGTSDAEPLVSAFKHELIAARYIYQAIPNKSMALNLAISETVGEIILFTDDDLRFPPEWLTGMCEPILKGRADAVAGGVRLAQHLRRPWMTRMHRSWLASTADYLSSEAPSELCGANMAITRHALNSIGGFDIELGPGTSISYGEEALASYQLKRAGFKLGSALDLEVEHHPRVDRLRYKHWTSAAVMKGRSRAYIMHHWYHEQLPSARLRHLFYRMKLLLRRMFSKGRRPDDEGIPPWEMSYILSASTYSHYIHERGRTRNYSLDSVRKITIDHTPVTL